MAARSDGARQWAAVLSDLAGVSVTVEWERPAWWVRWTDGPTRHILAARAIDLGRFRVGSPLAADSLRFARSSSPLALALAWLTVTDRAGRPETMGLVEQIVEDTGYPSKGADPATLAAADLLCRIAAGQPSVMGQLLAGAAPTVPVRPPARPVPDLVGRVVSIRWPVGGPPAHLLGLSEPSAASSTLAEPACAYCGAPLPPRTGRGRSARYCGGAHRVAAHRARQRESAKASSNDVT